MHGAVTIPRLGSANANFPNVQAADSVQRPAIFRASDYITTRRHYREKVEPFVGARLYVYGTRTGRDGEERRARRYRAGVCMQWPTGRQCSGSGLRSYGLRYVTADDLYAYYLHLLNKTRISVCCLSQ